MQRSREEAIADLHRSLNSAPSFIVVRGNVFFYMGGCHYLLPKEGKTWTRHGGFKTLYVDEDFALIEHTFGDKGKMPIFIPPKRRMSASSGRFVYTKVNHDSFVWAFDADTLVHRRHRTEFGCSFRFDGARRCWTTTAGGNLVNIFPSDDPKKTWVIQVPSTGKVDYLKGENLEQRAFSVAIGYSRQQIN